MHLTLPDIILVVGLLLLTAGLAGVDWRLACVVIGLALALIGGVALVRGA